MTDAGRGPTDDRDPSDGVNALAGINEHDGHLVGVRVTPPTGEEDDR
jgi:hypothetical protein